MSILQVLSRSVPLKSFDVATLTPSTGVAFALPARASALQWQTVYGTQPVAVNVVLEMTLDGTNWDTMDTSTAIAGEMRTFSNISAKQVRARVVSNTNGSTVTVLIQVD